MIAIVRVNFTVTALSRVSEPRFHIASHVEAAAVTEEVSFTAVPAKIPNPSPFVVENPSICPRYGKMIAARTLKKNITEIDCATSSSSAEITGAVAAIAEPPQIEDPTPINVEIFDGIFIILHSIKATARDVQIVEQIIGSDCMPVFATTAKSSPNPSRITAHCRTFFDVNLI